MLSENYEILIENIEKLMRQRGINQARLIEATNISQPQMSKGMNRNSKTQFTFDQIWKIADYFHVTIDFLVGRESSPTANPLSAAAICRYLMRLVESDTVTTQRIEVEEDMYTKDYCPDPDDYPYKWSKGKNSYTAYYFSNYVNPDISGLPEPMLDELQYDFGTSGNASAINAEINDFMDYFFKLYDLLKKSDLPQEIFDTAISDRLSQMDKR